jgi:hypothetical protein
MPRYHREAGWPTLNKYQYTRNLPGGKDTWVWQGHNIQNEMNRESKLNLKLPSAFSGKDRRKWKLFLTECAIYFQAKPKTYSGDVAKITFAASLLEDAALKHYTIMLQQQSDSKFFKEWPVFIANMGDMFGVLN